MPTLQPIGAIKVATEQYKLSSNKFDSESSMKKYLQRPIYGFAAQSLSAFNYKKLKIW